MAAAAALADQLSAALAVDALSTDAPGGATASEALCAPRTHWAPACATDDPASGAQADAAAAEDEALCAICLCGIEAANVALVKGCFHAYCAPCLVAWAAARAARFPGVDTPCPQCKATFAYVFLPRLLDGTPTEHLVEESMVLLMRASWAGPQPSQDAAVESSEEEAGDGLDDLDEEERLARVHRVHRLIGNRRFGGGGFVSSGRLLARPVPAPAPPPPQPRKQAAADAKPNPARAKREAKAAQAAEKEAQRRARRRERWAAPATAAAAEGAGPCEEEAAADC